MGKPVDSSSYIICKCKAKGEGTVKAMRKLSTTKK